MASDLASYRPWRISGTYLEACNEDGPLEFEFTEKCGYEASFDYSSE